MLIQFAFIFLTLIAQTGPSWQNEVKQIDQQITNLRDLQEKYRAQATRDEANAMRWQFQNRNYMDARKAWDKVAQDKQKIQEIQDQIDDLEDRRKKIIQENGKQTSPS